MTRLSLRTLAGVVLAAALSPLATHAQSDSARGMARVMTPREMEESGIGRLTPLERQRLDGWLLRYTAERLTRPTVPGLASLDRTIASGDYVQLSDGTIWSIYLPDRPAVVGWRAGDLIVVRQSGLGYGEYDYVLTNNSDGSRAFARLGGPPRDLDRPN